MNHKLRNRLLFFGAVAVAIGLDQWTKHLAVMHLKNKIPYVLLKDIFEFYYSENRGAAFGMMQGKQGFFFVVVLLVTAAVIYALYRMPLEKKYYPLEICLFLILSGALGNMIDRIRLGYVVDFLYFKLINFPIFNVADCYVTVATAFLMILFIFFYTDDDLKVFGLKRRVSEDAC